MDIFQKCYQFDRVESYKESGHYPYFRPISSAQDTEVMIQGKKYLMLGSNSYLGLTNHPEIKQASIDAILKYGTGNAGSRFLNGNLDIHEQLEYQFSQLLKKEDSLLFPTGWMTNVGVISSLVGPHDIIFCDRLNHASLFDAAKLSFSKKIVKYKHNDMEDLKVKLELFKDQNVGKLIISDGVFSMEGDVVHLPELVKIKQEYQARIFIDDAHGLGVFGKTGAGTLEHFDLIEEVDLVMGTFSKSFASLGGVVSGEKQVIHYLKHMSRAFIFSASSSAGNIAATLKALELMTTESWRLEALWKNTHLMNKELQNLGFNLGITESPILPIITNRMDITLEFWRQLSEEGIFVNPVIPPAVSDNACLIRLSVMATHQEDQLYFALEKLQKIGKKLGVLT